MQKTRILRSWLTCTVLLVLIAALALGMTGCSKQDDTGAPAQTTDGAEILGEGKLVFAFTVTDGDGKATAFEIHTDAETVGEALLALDLIAGDENEFGLYVKTVNGITADYDVDGTYWAFYIDGEYGATGVDATPITDGAHYEFRVE